LRVRWRAGGKPGKDCAARIGRLLLFLRDGPIGPGEHADHQTRGSDGTWCKDKGKVRKVSELEHGRKHGAEGGRAGGRARATKAAAKLVAKAVSKAGAKPRRKSKSWSRRGTGCVNWRASLPALATCSAPLKPQRDGCSCKAFPFPAGL